MSPFLSEYVYSCCQFLQSFDVNEMPVALQEMLGPLVQGGTPRHPPSQTEELYRVGISGRKTTANWSDQSMRKPFVPI